MKYLILNEHSAASLTEKVNRALFVGAEVCGGLSVSFDEYGRPKQCAGLFRVVLKAIHVEADGVYEP